MTPQDPSTDQKVPQIASRYGKNWWWMEMKRRPHARHTPPTTTLEVDILHNNHIYQLRTKIQSIMTPQDPSTDQKVPQIASRYGKNWWWMEMKRRPNDTIARASSCSFIEPPHLIDKLHHMLIGRFYISLNSNFFLFSPCQELQCASDHLSKFST